MDRIGGIYIMFKKILGYILLLSLMLISVVVGGSSVKMLYLGSFIIFACGGINIAICDSLNIVKLGMGVTRHHQNKMVLKHFSDDLLFSSIFMIVLIGFSLLVNKEMTCGIVDIIMLYMTTIVVFQISLMIFNTQYWPTTILFIISISFIVILVIVEEIEPSLLFSFSKWAIIIFCGVLSLISLFLNKVLYKRNLPV